MRFLFGIALALGLHSAAGAREAAQLPSTFAKCPDFFAQRPPAIAKSPQLRELCYDAFAILHNGKTKTPVFVAQRLDRHSVGGIPRQKGDRFFPDARLPRGERAELEDYKRSGYSRGHMAPAGDMHTPEAMAQSFSLANMVPQAQKQNSGPWAKIEQSTRRYIERAKGDVYVITGPVFDERSPRIGANGVWVPSHLFKLVYDPSTGKAWAHWQANHDDEVVSRPISYAELVQRTGIEWLKGAVNAQ
jgi:endonuclease G